MRRFMILSAAVVILICIFSCGGNGGGGSESDSFILSGKAVKEPISDAVIKLFYWSSGGEDVEIDLADAPILTSTDGSYNLSLDSVSLEGVASPIIVRAVGGKMGNPPANAPVLEGLIADPSLLTLSGGSLSRNLTVGSSVAACLIGKKAAENKAPPSVDEAIYAIALVEDQLGIALEDDPGDPTQSIAMLNRCVDQNLDLLNTPSNAPAVNEYIDYLAANLCSADEKLNATMDSPSLPGTDTAADFSFFGDGLLTAIIPDGPSGFVNLRLQSDVAFIEKTGFDIATLTAALTDATGAPLAAVSNITFNISSGSGTLSHRENDEVNGLAHIDLSSDKAGEITITAEYELPSGNILSQSVTVASVDLEKDTDGDGFSDGEESLGWTAANEKHVITR